MVVNRRLKILFILIACSFLMIGAFFGWKAYRDTHPESYGTFQAYSPTIIVNGLRITNKSLEVWENHPLLWFAPSTIIVRLHLDRDNSYITESKNVGLGDLACDAINTDCEEKKTSNGQIYTIKRVYSETGSTGKFDKLSTEEAIYSRDGVRIAIQINAVSDQTTPTQDWSAMIDSFEPTTFTDLKVKHMQPGP